MRRRACRERVAHGVLACAFVLAAPPRASSDERLPSRDPFGGFPERRSTSSPAQPWRGTLFAVPPHPSPSALPGVPAEHPRVRGIVTGPRAFALVEIGSDVRIVRAGDVLGGARVVRIDPGAVWMSDRRRLTLETRP